MDSFDLHDLKELMETKEFPLVSAFMPTVRAGKEVQQNPIRFKNVLGLASRKLADSGVKPADIERMLQPATRLLEDTHFWNHQLDGLSVFAGSGRFRTFRLPVTFKELVVVTDRFHVKPLVPYAADDRDFYVLAVSQKGFRLIHCTRHSAEEVPVPNAPKDIFEATSLSRHEKQLQFYTGAPGRGGKRSAIFHGTGASGGNPDIKKAILKYFHQIDRGIAPVLDGRHVPLVVAAVDRLIPLYREANTFAHLIERGLPGSPDEVVAEALRDRALELLEPEFQRERAKAAAKYEQMVGTGLASNDLEAVLAAAHQSRVETLFVPVGMNRWGRYDPESATAEVHEAEEPGDQDLLDLAAVQSLARGARVFAVAPDKVPGGGDNAAIFRF